jgi:hypothetical protein
LDLPILDGMNAGQLDTIGGSGLDK